MHVICTHAQKLPYMKIILPYISKNVNFEAHNSAQKKF